MQVNNTTNESSETSESSNSVIHQPSLLSPQASPLEVTIDSDSGSGSDLDNSEVMSPGTSNTSGPLSPCTTAELISSSNSSNSSSERQNCTTTSTTIVHNNTEKSNKQQAKMNTIKECTNNDAAVLSNNSNNNNQTQEEFCYQRKNTEVNNTNNNNQLDSINNSHQTSLWNSKNDEKHEESGVVLCENKVKAKQTSFLLDSQELTQQISTQNELKENGGEQQSQLQLQQQQQQAKNTTTTSIDAVNSNKVLNELNVESLLVDDASQYSKTPHWSQNIVYYDSISITECLISGGSDYGQLPYFTETGDIILEIDDIQVAGFTSADIEEILSRNLVHSFRLVNSAAGITTDLREYLSRRFARGSVDHRLQEVIRENIYSRTIPCTTRPAKEDEVDGVDYQFLGKEQFQEMERAGLLLESGVYCGHYYGTPLPTVNGNLSNLVTSNGMPLEQTLNGSTTSGLTSSQLSLAAKRKRNRSNLAAIDAATLPFGWERISDVHYGVYYIDHINKRTQYERPYEVELAKGMSGFGFTLIEIDKGLVVVKSLIQGGPAQASGVIQSGDVLVSVAGVSVSGLQHSDIAHLFSTFNVGDCVRLTFARGYQLPLGFNDEDYDIISLQISKGVQGFGFTISEGHNGQKVKKILDLERCVALRQGDILLSINGIDLTPLTHLEVVETLKQCPIDKPTEFMIKRKKRLPQSKTPMTLDLDSVVMQTHDANNMVDPTMRKPALPEVIYGYTKGPAPYTEYLVDELRNDGYGTNMAEYANNQVYMQSYDNGPPGLLGQPTYATQYEYMPYSQRSLKSLPQYKSPNYDAPSEMMWSGIGDIDYELIHVTLHRTENGFGFRIVGGAEEGSNVAIGSLVVGGAAYKDGVLKAGDEIVSINEINVLCATHQEVVQIMSQTGPTVRLIVRRRRYLNAYDITLYRQEGEGFGFVIISCGNCALIGRIIADSPAHRCQRLHVKDRIVAVNGADVTNLTHPEIVNMIKESGDSLHLRIIPADCYTIELNRGPSGYGFSIRGGIEYNGMPLFISAIAPNGPAASLLQVGNEILEINDCPTVGMSHNEAVQLISRGPLVKLRLRRNVTANDMLIASNGYESRMPSPQQIPLSPQSPLPTISGMLHSPSQHVQHQSATNHQFINTQQQQQQLSVPYNGANELNGGINGNGAMHQAHSPDIGTSKYAPNVMHY